MSDVVGGRVKPPAEQSTAELIQRASEQITRLVRDELRLARAELSDKGRTAGIGLGLLGGGGVVAMYGVAALLTALVLGLAEAMPAWVAALLVGAVLLAVAGVLALVGRGRVREAAPPVPEETVASVRRDIGAVASAVKERGEHR
ncbi:MAG TPA: phage holin family protein [Micromonosporaceae bacterium]|nr:phage holin family protein [Micromonosporaceae bacterium]